MTLTARELSLMRSEQDLHMPDTVDIFRRTLADDGFGGFDEQSVSQVGTGVRARVTQAQTITMLGQLSRDVELEKWTVRLPIGTDVQEEDELTWVGRGITFRVEDKQQRSWDTVVTLKCERIK